jgi:hypothetical protein
MTPDELKSWAEKVIRDLLASEEKKIREALCRDELFERCSKDFQAAKARYFSPKEVPSNEQSGLIFDRALNDLILAHSSHQPCPLW